MWNLLDVTWVFLLLLSLAITFKTPKGVAGDFLPWKKRISSSNSVGVLFQLNDRRKTWIVMEWCIPSSNWLCIWILKKKQKWPRIPILSLPGCCSNATTATIASHDLTTQKHRSWNVWEPRLSGVRCPKTPGLLSRFTATEADSSYERAGDQRSFSNRGRWGCDWLATESRNPCWPHVVIHRGLL